MNQLGEIAKWIAWATPGTTRASALFVGPAGTGKTMAVEVLTKQSGLSLHRVDIADLVSKHIGETEKNLERLFQRAEASRALLLFDEADAFFAKRNEVEGVTTATSRRWAPISSSDWTSPAVRVFSPRTRGRTSTKRSCDGSLSS